jgi:Domain of unknown function (DUF4260)
MLTRPRWVLRAEGAVIFIGSVLLYGHGHYHWWVFAVLFLAPDLSMLGYLVNVRLGAMCYNLVHTEVGPVIVLLFAWLSMPRLLPFGLIWLGHLGFDRMLGYGLKYPTKFRDTHLQHL